MAAKYFSKYCFGFQIPLTIEIFAAFTQRVIIFAVELDYGGT